MTADKFQKIGEILMKKMLENGYLELDVNGDFLITDKGMLRIDDLIKNRIHDIYYNKMIDKQRYYNLLDKERSELLKSVKHPVEALIVLEGEKAAFDKFNKFNKESLH